MKNLAFLIVLTGILTNAFAQSTLVWSKNFAASMIYADYEGPSMSVNSDTIKVLGRTNSTTGQSLLMVNYNLSGDTLSSFLYGNDSLNNSTIIDYKFDLSKAVYILHKEQLSTFKSKIVLQKYSSNGNLLWFEQIQDVADTSYYPKYLGLIDDSCIIITAYKEYDYPEPGDDVFFTTSLPYIYAFNRNGDKLWSRELNSNNELSYFNFGNFVYNGSAYIFGTNSQSVNCLYTLLRVFPDGTVIPSDYFSMPNGINCVQLTPDSNLLISSGARYRITKMDLNGNLLWTKPYGTNLPSNVGGDNIESTIQDSAGNIYITGTHYGEGYGTANYSSGDILTIKYDIDGNLVWKNRYTLENQNYEIGHVVTIKNGYVYVGGHCQRNSSAFDYDYIVLKMDAAEGLLTGVYRYNGAESGNESISSLAVFDNGNVALTGLSYIDSQYDWTTQLLSDVILSTEIIDSKINLEIYPNPVINGDFLTIIGNHYKAYSITSAIGQTIQNGPLTENSLNRIMIENTKCGVYFLQLQNENEISTRKIIIQ
jgi:hypothetical protein